MNLPSCLQGLSVTSLPEALQDVWFTGVECHGMLPHIKVLEQRHYVSGHMTRENADPSS